MQLTQPTFKQFSTEANPEFIQVLCNIASQVELQSNFSIHHPEYKPFELPEEVVTSLVKMPKQVQQRYASLQLRGFLYGIYYNGHLLKSLALDVDSKDLPKNLENSTFLGVDQQFIEKLHNSNKSSGYFDEGWLILQDKNDENLVVQKGDLKLHIQRQHHLQPTEQSATVGKQVAILMPKNFIQKGFYTAVGNSGLQGQVEQKPLRETVRFYFNLRPEGAIALMEILTRQLNDFSIPFTFKVLYNPADYGRYDSAVLYFNKCQYETVQKVVKLAYAETQSSFYPEVPLFTKKLAPGLGLAEEPDSKLNGESFGENRCQIVANGLLKAIQTGDNSLEGRMKAIYEEFANVKVNCCYPYLNPDSTDIYCSLD